MTTDLNNRPAAPARFFVTGGTLPPDSPSYVSRQADDDLFDALRAGEFCFVLDPRQIGKSSLMVRAARRLREAGVAVAVLDLTALGQNLTPDQWYTGLLGQLSEQLSLEDECEEFWERQEALSPWQRWARTLQEVVLPCCPGPLVVFVDEIDAVCSLPFPADEFFAGIRALYNRRAEEPELARLTFCLLGVAAPADLIRDVRTTPFNVGRRVELTDFTAEEAAPLAAGLGAGGALLRRVLFWTGGHPYLTQRLCQAISRKGGAMAADVDRACEELFLSRRARETDDNLAFVRNRLLQGDANVADLLDSYLRVWRGRPPVLDGAASPLVSALRLSGIARAEGGRLQVRNRIYARVFDKAWVRDSLPDAEARRQRAAFRRGALRATAVAAVVVALIGALAWAAMRQARRANEAALTERRLLYVADVNVAEQAVSDENYGQAAQALDEVRPKPGEPDLRGWEWRWLWRQSRDDSLMVLRGHLGPVTAVAFSPDGQTLATGGLDTTVRLWDAATGQPLAVRQVSSGVTRCLAFSPDGHFLAVGNDDGQLIVMDARTQQVVTVRPVGTGGVYALAFSPDGRRLALGSTVGAVQVWNVGTWRAVTTLRHNIPAGAFVQALAFSPDGRFLVVGSGEGKTRLWDTATWGLRATLPGGSASWSPDGRRLVSTYDYQRTKTVLLYDVATGRRIGRLGDYRSYPRDAEFSPDGKIVAVADGNSVVTLWEANSRQPLGRLHGQKDGIFSVAFSPDGRRLATGGGDGTARFWPTAPATEVSALPSAEMNAVAFSPDGRLLASGARDAKTRLWDPQTGRLRALLSGHTKWVNSADFSPDGRTLATASDDGTVRLWDVAARRTVTILRHPGIQSAVCARFSPTGRRLAVDEDGAALRLWDVDTGREFGPLDGPLGAVTGRREPLECFAWSPDGRLIAGGLAFGNVRLWDAASRRSIALLPGQTAAVMCLAFSPDGRTLAASSDDGTILLRDVRTRRVVALLSAHVGPVMQIAFSRDGRTLAAAGAGVLVFWNLATLRPAPLVEQTHITPDSLAFSPDGNTLAIGHMASRISLWRAPTFVETDKDNGGAIIP